MATVAITKTTIPDFYSQTGAALTMAAGDASNFNHIVADGEGLLVAQNTGAGSRTITITSVADPGNGRTGNVAAQALAAGEIRVFHLRPRGWANSSGQIVVTVSHAEVKLGFVQY